MQNKEKRNVWRMAKLATFAAVFSLAATVSATEYYMWDGTGNTGNWNDKNNWEHSTNNINWKASTIYPSYYKYVVSIPEDGDEALEFTGDSFYTGILTINRPVTLKGSWYLSRIKSENSSVLTLDGVTFLADPSLPEGTNFMDVVIVGTVTKESAGRLTMFGKVSGDRNAVLKNSGTSTTQGFVFYGDLSDFCGTYEGSEAKTSVKGDRDRTEIRSANSSSSNAVWKLGYYSTSGTSPLKISGQSDTEYATYYFGALVTRPAGFSLKDVSYANLEIGARDDVDSTLQIASNDWVGISNKVTKVGAGKLNLVDARIAELEVKSGEVYVRGAAPETMKISGSRASLFVASTIDAVPVSGREGCAVSEAAEETVVGGVTYKKYVLEAGGGGLIIIIGDASVSARSPQNSARMRF